MKAIVYTEYGPGVLGSLYAARLQVAGQDVKFYRNRWHKDRDTGLYARRQVVEKEIQGLRNHVISSEG